MATDHALLTTNLVTVAMTKSKSAISQYASASEAYVATISSPTTLMALLFDKACTLLKRAIHPSNASDLETFHQSTLHALQIVLSLRFVLDTDSDTELSQSLFATYTSIAASLKKAKDEKDIQAIESIYEALDELRTAWHSVAR